MFPPAGSQFGIDYSFARFAPKWLAARGVRHVGRYLWNDKYADGVTPNKGINRAEYDALRAAGLQVFFFYETTAEDSMAGGYDVGVKHAKAAQAYLDKLGLPTAPVHFNVDHDATAAQLPAILEGMRGATSVLGDKKRVGIYGEYDVVKAALDAGYTYACQTYAWSGGKWDPRATTQQWSNGQWNNSVDFNRAMRADFGQA